jgi:hypothetical protein
MGTFLICSKRGQGWIGEGGGARASWLEDQLGELFLGLPGTGTRFSP